MIEVDANSITHRDVRERVTQFVVKGAIDGRILGDDAYATRHDYRDNSRRNSSTRGVCSQANPLSARPKCPYAAVRR